MGSPRASDEKPVTILPIPGLPEIRAGHDLAKSIVQAAEAAAIKFQPGDMLVVTQKIVSKAEKRIIPLNRIEPSLFALQAAGSVEKDPRIVEAVLREARRVVRMARGIILAETRQGFVCANAGIDQSNVEHGQVALLPLDPDRSAWRIRQGIAQLTGVRVAVIISDTFGRPWREGYTDVAIGVAGLRPLKDYRGLKDPYGYELRVTVMAVADELAAAAELVMGKLNRVPVALIRGYSYTPGRQSARRLVRPPHRDLFR